MSGNARVGVWNSFDKPAIPTIKPNEMEMDVLKFDMTELAYRRVLVYVTWRNGSFVVEYEIVRDGTSISFQQLNRPGR